MARDTVEPSPLSHELLNANPYAFLDDAPLEERRTRAVQLRRGLPAPIDRRSDASARSTRPRSPLAAEEVAPTVRDADELHDALLALWLVPEPLGESLAPGARDWFDALAATGRACRLRWESPRGDPTVVTPRGSRPSGSAPRARCSARPSSATPMIATPTWADAARARGRDQQARQRAPRSSRPGHARARSPRELGLPLSRRARRAARARGRRRDPARHVHDRGARAPRSARCKRGARRRRRQRAARRHRVVQPPRARAHPSPDAREAAQGDRAGQRRRR